MTERLYYKDPTLLEFDAQVVKQGKLDDKTFVVLDKTAFYPTSGGQPFDTGMLNDIRVVEVSEDDSGNIRHFIEKELPDKSAHGKIDYERRQYFRQLHTAQHILSRAFINLYEFETVSVHLGEDYGAVEFPVKEVTENQCRQAELLSNQTIEQNQPIEIIFADEAEAANLPLRKKPERSGTIRVIRIGELDYSACGGTHCCSTSEVGLIKIIAVERQRSNALVKFLAGKSAIDDYKLRFGITDSLTKQLTCDVSDLPSKLEKLNDENKMLRKQLAQAQQELLPMKVESMASTAEDFGKCKIVILGISDLDPKLLNRLATETAAKISGLAALLLDNRLCVAVADDVGLDAGRIVKRLSELLKLKGGGGKTLAQLGGVKPEEIEKYRELLKSIINE